jgi:hypothetical protein
LFIKLKAKFNAEDLDVAAMDSQDGLIMARNLNYSFTYQGGIGSSPNKMVNDIMRSCSKNMPYSKN